MATTTSTCLGVRFIFNSFTSAAVRSGINRSDIRTGFQHRNQIVQKRRYFPRVQQHWLHHQRRQTNRRQRRIGLDQFFYFRGVRRCNHGAIVSRHHLRTSANVHISFKEKKQLHVRLPCPIRDIPMFGSCLTDITLTDQVDQEKNKKYFAGLFRGGIER
jgi:hypothetical protein